MSVPIYLDHHSTTPVDNRVVDAMVDALRSTFGNPASRHDVGAWAEQAVQKAQRAIAGLINANPDDVFFTSGATESNNLVIAGATARRQGRSSLVISTVEHPSVLEPAEAQIPGGVEVRRALPSDDGRVTAEEVSALVDGTTFLVSVMLANNEIGVINPVGELAATCHGRGALLHSDATQAVGHVPVDVDALGVDLLSFSAHKFYGPKGIGVVYARRGARRRVAPGILGGGHQRGFRSGTLNVPAIVGFGVAAEIARKEMKVSEYRIAHLRDLLLKLLQEKASPVAVNGTLEHRLPGNLSVYLPGIDAEALVVRLRDVAAFSTGAACSSAKVEPSHVLVALEQDHNRAFSSVRFGIGRSNTEEQIRHAAKALAKEASILRRMSGASTPQKSQRSL